MFLKSLKTMIWMVLCLAALAAFTGCQSGSPLDLNDEAENAGEAEGPIVVDEPVMPKEGSDWVQVDPDIVLEMQDILFNLQHIPLVSGDNNNIDHTDYMFQSGDVHENSGDVVLKSTWQQMAFITYGFRNIPEGEELTRVTVRGIMDTQMFNPSGGLYIGISDYDIGNYRWFGPLGTECEYELPVWNINTTNSKQRAYVTLAVYNADHYTVQDIDVRVGEQLYIPEFEWELFDIMEFVDPLGQVDLGLLREDLFGVIPMIPLV